MTLSTDIIVGFPGETEDDFHATLTLLDEVRFTSLFGFKFSPRPHTPALKLVDDVPEEVKSERLARLFEKAEVHGRAHLRSLVGSTQRVLVEGASKNARTLNEAARYEGRTDRNEIVHVEVGTEFDAIGQVVEVDVVDAYKHSLFARPTEKALSRLP